MVNAMRNQRDPECTTRPVLTPEVRYGISQKLVGEDEILQHDSLAEQTFRAYHDLWRKRGLSGADIGINLRVLHIQSIAYSWFDLVELTEEKYQCQRITAIGLAIKEIDRQMEKTRQLLQGVSHPLDKAALDELANLLDNLALAPANQLYLLEAQRVGAVPSEGFVFEGRVYQTQRTLDESERELIEARYALDCIWDREPLMDCTTERNMQLAKSLKPKLDRDPKVGEVRRSLDIPPEGFEDLDSAHQWARTRWPDWSRRDDAYWEELVWWESYTWDPDFGRPTGRGYIALHLPKMNETLECLVSEYRLGRGWYRVLPLYLVRGKLEPPPKVKKGQPRKSERDELLTDLVDEYGYDLAQIIYNGQLALEDVAKIRERNPKISPVDLYIELQKLADERESWLSEDSEDKPIEYDALRKLVSRTLTRRAAYATYKERVTQMGA